jgi:GNAT superfamily N-acetyltransferase
MAALLAKADEEDVEVDGIEDDDEDDDDEEEEGCCCCCDRLANGAAARSLWRNNGLGSGLLEEVLDAKEEGIIFGLGGCRVWAGCWGRLLKLGLIMWLFFFSRVGLAWLGFWWLTELAFQKK